MPRFLVISSSLNPTSRSRVLAQRVHARLNDLGEPADWMDLQQVPLPPCTGTEVDRTPAVADAQGRIARAAGVLVAGPVYNYDIGAAAKNLVELTGAAWEGKVVGFATAAGGSGSYMSVMSLAGSLMLDFRCHVVPRFVYATTKDVDGSGSGRILSADIAERLDRLAAELRRLALALAAPEAMDDEDPLAGTQLGGVTGGLSRA